MAIDVHLVRRAFYSALDAREDAAAVQRWWVSKVFENPNELIVDDDDGTLYRVPFTVNGDAVEFTDPVEVRATYVDVRRRAKPAETPGTLSELLR